MNEIVPRKPLFAPRREPDRLGGDRRFLLVAAALRFARASRRKTVRGTAFL